MRTIRDHVHRAGPLEPSLKQLVRQHEEAANDNHAKGSQAGQEDRHLTIGKKIAQFQIPLTTPAPTSPRRICSLKLLEMPVEIGGVVARGLSGSSNKNPGIAAGVLHVLDRLKRAGP